MLAALIFTGIVCCFLWAIVCFLDNLNNYSDD